MTIRVAVAFCVLAAVVVSAQAPPPAAQKFKAIWEPVPFTRDVNLTAIACVAAETCWIAGDKSTILFTADGGATWQVQLGGDPESTDDDFAQVFFLDAKHGWALTERGKILGTTDGSTWAELSTVSGTSQGVWFQTPRTGVTFDNPDSTTHSTIRRTTDGGRTWTASGRCSVEASVNGLPRTLPCRLFTAHFVSPTSGFAGGVAPVDMATSLTTFGKTTDGGETWTMAVIPEHRRRVTALRFWSERDGIAVLDRGEEILWTADGGQTWTRSVKQRVWPSVYGVAGSAMIVGIGESGGIGYSTDGGRRFTSRPLALPARAAAVTFADPQHGYLIGQHAMVYRYRIVPMDYTKAGMLPAMAP